MYTLLSQCFKPQCAPLVGYLCNHLTTDFNPPADVPSSLSSETLVSAAASLGTLATDAQTNIAEIVNAFKSAGGSVGATGATGGSQADDLIVDFIAAVPASGLPTDLGS